jgi:hypothetical protein
MAGEFKVQLLETFAALITAAFGLVAALAWNETIKAAVKLVFGEADDLLGNFIYAIIVTILAVIMTIWIARALGKAKDAMDNKEE